MHWPADEPAAAPRRPTGHRTSPALLSRYRLQGCGVPFVGGTASAACPTGSPAGGGGNATSPAPAPANQTAAGAAEEEEGKKAKTSIWGAIKERKGERVEKVAAIAGAAHKADGGDGKEQGHASHGGAGRRLAA